MAKLQNYMMRFAAVLLCLTLFSLYLLCGMYARYTAQDSGGGDARTAKFCISESDSLESRTYAVEIAPDVPESLEVQITNFSETAVQYTLEFLTEGSLPIEITPNQGDDLGKTLIQEKSNVWTTVRAANLNKTETYTFNLKLSDRGYIYSGGIAMITLTLKAEQVD